MSILRFLILSCMRDLAPTADTDLTLFQVRPAQGQASRSDTTYCAEESGRARDTASGDLDAASSQCSSGREGYGGTGQAGELSSSDLIPIGQRFLA